jgi:hypothetical protein
MYRGREYDTIHAVSAEQAMTWSRYRMNKGDHEKMRQMPLERFDAILHSEVYPNRVRRTWRRAS